MNAPLETEIKIPVDDLEPIQTMLRSTSAELIHQMKREINVLYESPQNHLLSEGRSLRMRRYGDHHILTLKGPVKYLGAVKQREELEVDVGDFNCMSRILQTLGFKPCARYEKDREVWRLDGLTVVADHTPMGNFVEVEGPEQKISIVARRIGLDPAQGIRGSYLGLWQEFRLRHPDRNLPIDMVFE